MEHHNAIHAGEIREPNGVDETGIQAITLLRARLAKDGDENELTSDKSGVQLSLRSYRTLISVVIETLNDPRIQSISQEVLPSEFQTIIFIEDRVLSNFRAGPTDLKWSSLEDFASFLERFITAIKAST